MRRCASSGSTRPFLTSSRSARNWDAVFTDTVVLLMSGPGGVEPIIDDRRRYAHPRLVFLRSPHPRSLRVAPLLPGVLVHEAQERTTAAEGQLQRSARRHHPAAAL